jgi:hypothetical protein
MEKSHGIWNEKNIFFQKLFLKKFFFFFFFFFSKKVFETIFFKNQIPCDFPKSFLRPIYLFLYILITLFIIIIFYFLLFLFFYKS